jgi:hypothetical protein
MTSRRRLVVVIEPTVRRMAGWSRVGSTRRGCIGSASDPMRPDMAELGLAGSPMRLRAFASSLRHRSTNRRECQ